MGVFVVLEPVWVLQCFRLDVIRMLRETIDHYYTNFETETDIPNCFAYVETGSLNYRSQPKCSSVVFVCPNIDFFRNLWRQFDETRVRVPTG